MEIKVFLFRIFVCFILSVAIGLERQWRHKMVGLRTNVLVSLGAFMFVYLSFGIDAADKTRIAAQVVSGIGFLGAGVILREGNKIKGLNTAATLWCVAAIGVLTSSGMIIEAAIGTGLVLASNIFLRLLSISIMNKVSKYNKELCYINIICKKNIEVVARTSIAKYIEKNNLTLKNLERKVLQQSKVELQVQIITSRIQLMQGFINNISKEPGVVSIEYKHEKIYNSESDEQDLNDSE